MLQTVTGAKVTNGATAAPTLALGAVHVGGSSTQSFAIANTGVNDPSLRGAIQTTGTSRRKSNARPKAPKRDPWIPC
ncbi:hypothetical protein [Roseiarcus fermentans]|uniref:hypothetical protein n=1 Tax=Roseiarcus fermentans TaxID=1473586 RepID=UPI0011BF8F79|nr:hypothetical protein [Roseiarcus fermentans]